MPEISYARNGDVSIAYQTLGSGPPDIAFVTGFVFHLELIWEQRLVRSFFERLASFSRLLWDKREQGLSDRLGTRWPSTVPLSSAGRRRSAVGLSCGPAPS